MENLAFDSNILKKIPEKPGIYLFKDSKGQILYIGKAKNLKRRISSYLNNSVKSSKKDILVTKVRFLDIILVRTEKEALLLEANLIKKYKPRYNIVLRDDKAYPLLKISLREKFPTLRVVRKRSLDGALYFGPYTSSKALKETLYILRKIFPLRSCSLSTFKKRKRPCLYYQIGRCLAPCIGKINEQEYKQIVKGTVSFLQGDIQGVLTKLEKEMNYYAQRWEYEKAALIRDRINYIKKVLEKQSVILDSREEIDVFALAQKEDTFLVSIFFFRAGLLVGKKNMSFRKKGLFPHELLSLIIRQFYDEKRYIPSKIIVPLKIENQEVISSWLSEIANKKVNIELPIEDTDKLLYDLAHKNVLEEIKNRDNYEHLALEISKYLLLSRPPIRIEGVDLSHIQGKAPVGAIVCFFQGEPQKDQYRLYHLKGISFPDDYAMLQEVLLRRLSKGKKEGILPDLLLIDGAKGHLEVARKLLKELTLENKVAVCAIAKDLSGIDKIYIPQRKNPLIFRRHSKILLFFQKIRDEVHRFVLSFHRKVRTKEGLKSWLDDVPGIGPKRKKILWAHFSSFEKLKAASEEELATLPSMNKKIARTLKEWLKRA